MVGLGVDFADAPAYATHNDLGTAVLLAALAERRFRGRFVLASSMVVYGEGRYRCPAHGVVRPGTPRRGSARARRVGPGVPGLLDTTRSRPCSGVCSSDPRNVYAATKVHQEHLCFAFGVVQDVAVTALRYHNVYGPRMPWESPYSGVAALFRSEVEAERAASLRGR